MGQLQEHYRLCEKLMLILDKQLHLSILCAMTSSLKAHPSSTPAAKPSDIHSSRT